MISKLTQLLGEMCLILSKNRTAPRYAVVKKSRLQNFSKFLMLTLISLIGFNSQTHAQCVMPDVISPDAVCITALTVSLDSNGDGIITPQDIDNGSSDACGIMNRLLSQSTFTCADLGFSSTTLTVSDAAGNSNSCITNLLIQDVIAPVITCPMDVTVNCNDPTSVAAVGDATAVDNCDTNPTISSSNMVVTSSTGADCKNGERTFTATDADGNMSTCVQTITVDDTVSPVLDFGMMGAPNDTLLTCMDVIPMAPTAMMTDNCAPDATITAVDSISQGGNTLMCDFYDYTITRTWTATDACGNTDEHIQTITIENSPIFNNSAPTALNLSANSVVGCPNSCSAQVNLDLTSNLEYNCGITGSQLASTSFAIIDAAGATVISGPNLIINSICLNNGVYDANFSATDYCGNTTTHTVVITIEDDLAPTASCVDNINIALPAVGQYVIDAQNDLDNNSSDNCATALTYTASPAILDCSVTEQMIGDMVTATLTVSDGTLSASCETTITIVNSPPVSRCQDITVALDANGDYVVQANEIDNNSVDQCHTLPLSFLISDDGINFAATLALDCSNIGSVPVELEVTDADGMSGTCLANITVEDNMDPVEMCSAFTTYQVTLNNDGMYTLTDTDSIMFTNLFSDNCDFHILPSVTSFDCSDVDPNTGVMTTITVVDASENPILDMNGDAITCEVEIEVIDSTPPILDCADIEVSVDGQGDITISPEDLLAGSIFIQSGDNGSGASGNNRICIDAANATTLSFDYSVITNDPNGVDGEIFSYRVNGVNTQIWGPNSIIPSPVSVTLNAGDEFCFNMFTSDNMNGPATATVDNIQAGLIGDYAIANWQTPTAINSDGDLFFNDACGIDRYEIRCVGDPNWSTSLSYDCDDLETLFGGPLCGPQTKSFEIRAFDVNNNVSLNNCTSAVTFIDKQPPVPVCDARTVSLSTGAVTLPAGLFNDGSFDVCSEMNPGRYAIARPADGIYQDDLTFDCDSVGVFPISLRVEDCSGNQAFCTTTVTIQENQPPKIHCSPDITIDCSQSTAPMVTGFPVLVEDACSAVDTTFTDVFVSGLDASCSLFERTWTATDQSGNSTVCIQMINIEDNIAPTFVVPDDITLFNCEDTNDASVVGFPDSLMDNCTARPRLRVNDAGFVMSYATPGAWGTNIIGNGSGGFVSAFGTDSLRLYGTNDFDCSQLPTPDSTQVNFGIMIPADGDIRFTWEYFSSDSTGSAADDPFGYILNGVFTQLTGTAPIDTGIEIVSVQMGDMFSFSQQTNTSSCGRAQTSINNFSGPQAACVSSFVRTWIATDNCGNETTGEQIITMDITSPPVITFPSSIQAVSNGNGTCSAFAAVDFSNAVSGNCGGIVITNTAQNDFGAGDGMADASGNYPVGTHTVTFKIESTFACFATDIYEVTVVVQDGTSPVLQCTQSIQNIVLNSAGQGVFLLNNGLYTAFDDCGINSVVVSPNTFDCSDVGVTDTVTLTVSDPSGNSNSCNLNINITPSNTTTLTCPGNMTVDCSNFTGVTGNFGLPVTGGVCGTSTAVVSSNTVISGTPNNCFTFERVWTAGANSCTQTITVEDNIAPIIDPAPMDTILNVSDPNLAVTLNYTDNCAPDGMITSVDNLMNQGTDPCTCNFYNYDLIRSWVAMDGCGNQDSVGQTITLQDVSMPTFSFPSSLVIENDPSVCGAQVDLTIADFIADDAPFSCLTITNDALANHGNGNGMNDIDGFYPVGSYNITFVVTDPCGNTATEVLNLQIVDTENVALPCFTLIDLNLDNTGNATITEANILNGPIVDNCSMGNFTFSLSNSDFTCSDIGPLNTTTLTATDQFGNANTCTVTVNVLSTFINVGFTTMTSATRASNLLAADGTASVVVTGGSGSSSYLWDDANAQTTATATGLIPGLYTVIVTDDDTGCIHTDEVVVASLCPTFSIGQAAGGLEEVVSVPVTIENFTNVVSFQFTLNVNPVVAQFLGASNFTLPGLTANNFSMVMSSGGVLTVSWIDPGGAPGTTLPDGTALFDIDLMIQGTASNSTLVSINSTPVNYEIGQFLNGNVVSVPGCNNDGSVSINTSLALAQVCGNIVTENGTPVENVEVFETNSGAVDSTDVNGDYCLTVSTGTNACVEPFKDNNHFGSSSIDLFLIQQHILGNLPLTSPYQVIAADANNSGSVSTLDLVDLQFLILGNFTTLPNNDFWRFVDANQTFPNPLAPFPFDEKINLGVVSMDFLNTDFIAVAIGDVNGTAQSLLTDGSVALRSNNSFDLNVYDQSAKKGETFEVTFNASEYADIAGYQMTLEFDADNIQFEAVESLHIDNLNENNFATNSADQGIISLNWYGLQTKTFKDSEALFTLKFKALKDVPTLKGLLNSTSTVTKAEAYKMTDNELEYMNLDLIINKNTTISTDFALFDNRPNPFRNETTIGFTLPNDAATTITVFDVSGKILMQINDDFNKGYNEQTINASEIGSSGILYYEIKTEENTATGRMILLK